MPFPWARQRSQRLHKRSWLAGFRNKVEDAKHANYWATSDELAGKVALSFGRFTKTYPAVGWIRGDVQTTAESLAEINQLRKQLAELEVSLDRARTSPPVGTQDLAQGSDRVELLMSYRVEIQKPGETYPRSSRSGTVEVMPAWDEIFYVLGPLMLDEASERALDKRLDAWANDEFWDEVVGDLERWSKSVGLNASELRLSNYTNAIESTDFHTVLVQLMALGLIEQSTRRRAVSDKATYWALTPYGKTRLVQLRAVKKGATTRTAATEASESPDMTTPAKRSSSPKKTPAKKAAKKATPAKKAGG
jgi:hypothetical protein